MNKSKKTPNQKRLDISNSTAALSLFSNRCNFPARSSVAQFSFKSHGSFGELKPNKPKRGRIDNPFRRSRINKCRTDNQGLLVRFILFTKYFILFGKNLFKRGLQLKCQGPYLCFRIFLIRILETVDFHRMDLDLLVFR